MTIVRQILANKGNQVWSVDPNDLVIDALRLMADKRIGALMVMANDRVIGIFSERDYARKVILEGKSSATTRVGEIMTRDVISVNPDHTVEDCMTIMTENRVRHLPVYDDDKVIGVISIGDVVKTVIQDKQFMIEQLEQYITGS